jgi:hypothetical protein
LSILRLTEAERGPIALPVNELVFGAIPVVVYGLTGSLGFWIGGFSSTFGGASPPDNGPF